MSERLSDERLEEIADLWLFSINAAFKRWPTDPTYEAKHLSARAELIAELRSLRAECEAAKSRFSDLLNEFAVTSNTRDQFSIQAALLTEELAAAKARRIPNLDAMTVEELDAFVRHLDALKAYAHGSMFGGRQEKQEQVYAALPSWAKFREE